MAGAAFDADAERRRPRFGVAGTRRFPLGWPHGQARAPAVDPEGWLAFLILSVLWVLLYRFVNPPITFTEAADAVSGNGASRQWTPIERIDRDMVRAAIAGEDGKFCRHNGFDRRRWSRRCGATPPAAASCAAARRSASRPPRTSSSGRAAAISAKGLEAWFTLLIETLWGKRRIMEVYLNVAETGIGTYGVDAGAQRYFGHGAARLTPAEAARIAAVFPLPKRATAVDPRGFTRRYGNMIRRIGVVAARRPGCLRLRRSYRPARGAGGPSAAGAGPGRAPPPP